MNAIGDAAVETEHVRIRFTCSRVAAKKKRGGKGIQMETFSLSDRDFFLHVLAFNAR